MNQLRSGISLLAICAILLAGFSAASAAPTAQETVSVAIAGTLQSENGCDADWLPACEKTFLTYDEEDGIWQGTFQVQPGDDQDKRGSRYKAALNGSWDENYGQNAQAGGADIPLLVQGPRTAKFYFDPSTHWVTDNVNSLIITAVGDFQTQLGCKTDGDAGCLRAWLKDPEGSGTYSFTTTNLKSGTYQMTLAQGEDPADLLGAEQTFTVANDGDEIYFGYDPMKKETLISTSGAPKGSLAKLKAIWVNQDTLLWNIAGSGTYTYTLVYSPTAGLELSADGIAAGTGGGEIPLAFSKSGPGGDVFQRNPYLAGWSAFKIAPEYLADLRTVVKGQLAVVARDGKGSVVDATGVQSAGVLDALFSTDAALGPTFSGGIPTLRVWAPTAQSVRLHLFADAVTSDAEVVDMTADEQSGVWSVTGQATWKGQFYLYEVRVFVPSTGRIETNLVTDPYSLSLSTNSLRSQIVDLSDPALEPDGWDGLVKPALEAPEDIVLYELHIRDFSISDPTVPADLRGTYKAFTLPDSDGMRHLAELAQAGLTHIHLLPAFDIASVNEDKSTWKNADAAALAALPADSSEQAAAVALIKGEDGFNWGYDPYHYTTPEGSYATDPNGPARVREFREMVSGLNQAGLRVVMDVVYNHTSESGQNPRSVLDKIVPGYYYRLDAEGRVETSTCCQNTASEHRMMEKLMVDSLVTWARAYKIDGFRFDLMGHHMLSNMQAARAALDALTLEKDGVDGKSIYLYGEGWDFGEVAGNARGVNAVQLNIGGTGIGVFNDRLRDGVRGGTPFGDPREQGFATGLLFEPNAAEQRDPETQTEELLAAADWIRLGLAGNLRGFLLTRANGDTLPGERLLYNGSAAAYTLDPQENIVYVSAHDNETIFDAVQTKAAEDLPLSERIRMNNLALSLVMFSQGVPFFHAGDDLLRSKSLDRNSYDSGDWYNRLDWSRQASNWGAGLPLDAGDKAEYFAPLLADPALKPAPNDIAAAAAVFRENLRIRKSSPLFRLRTAEQVQRALSFFNTGKNQIPGLIGFRLTDADGLDPVYNEIVVLFNANPKTVVFAAGELAEKMYQLHPIQKESADPRAREASYDPSGAFSIPGRTAAVFVLSGPNPAPPAENGAGAQELPTPSSTPEANIPPRTGLLFAAGAAALAGLAGLIAFLWRRRRLS